MTYVLLLTGVIFLQIFWALTDPRPIKEIISGLFKNPIYRVSLVTIFLLSFFKSFYFSFPETNYDFQISVIGLIILYIGVFIAVWAKVTMGRNWGVPASFNKTRQKELVIKGPFAFSRNPIYLGLILWFFGYFITLRSYLIIFAFLGFWYFRKAAIKEEKIMEKAFGEKYLKYKQKTKRFI